MKIVIVYERPSAPSPPSKRYSWLGCPSREEYEEVQQRLVRDADPADPWAPTVVLYEAPAENADEAKRVFRAWCAEHEGVE